MKIRLLLAMIALAALALAAAAQSYQIRLTYNTNLRGSYSLEAARVETVAAGTTLEVIGSYNRWLKISRNGEVWMADWVAHTRVEGRQPAESDIDNCCYVDRQCTADHEWTSGWWAHQRNECPVGTSSTQQTWPQPASSGPAGVDNCCFTGWQCATEQEWINGYVAFQRNHCERGPGSFSQPGPAAYSHGRVRITQLSEGFATMVHNAFELLRTRAPEWYSYVANVLNGVAEVHGAETSYVVPSTAIAYFNHAPHSIRPYIPQDNITMAEFLVHEACHVYQYRQGRLNQPQKNQCECVRKEHTASLLIDPNGANIAADRAYLANQC